MSFKFDDDDDELRLDLGKDAPKTQTPAPLPKTVKPTKDALSKLPSPGQAAGKPVLPAQPKSEQAPPPRKQEAPKIPSSPNKSVKPEAVETVLPSPTPVKIIKEEPEAVEYVDDSYEEEALPSYEEKVIHVEQKETPQPVLNTATRKTRRRESYIKNGEFVPESINILSEEETNSTFKKKSPFDGDRKRVMQIRVVATTVAVLLMAAGIYSFIPKPGFKDDISSINAAISFSNKYDAIRTTSEAYALRFTTDFLNRTEVSEPTRQALMQNYMDPKALSPVDFTLTKIKASTSKDVNVYMRPIGGPYVYSISNIDAAKIQSQRIDSGNGFIYSIVTSTYVQPYISSSDSKYFTEGLPPMDAKWVYLSVPVMYNYDTKQTTLYGFPSFYSPEKISGLDKFANVFTDADWPQGDEALSSNSVLKAQLETFLTEWAKQSPNSAVSSSLTAVLSSDATARAKAGLGGAYVASKDGKIISEVNVKPMPQDVKADATTLREALVTVKWVDNMPNATPQYIPAVYTQQYMIYFKGSGDKWQIQDIKARYAE